MTDGQPDLVAHLDLGYDPVAANMLQRVGGKGSRGPIVHDGVSTWRTTRTESGTATVRITPAHHGADVAAWGSGASEAVALVPDLLGFSDDPSALVALDPVVAGLLRRRSSYRMTRTNSIWEHMITTVLGQKVPVASAARSWQGILSRWGVTPPGPAPQLLLLGPHPDSIAELAYYDFHNFHVERKRAQVLISFARRWRTLERVLEVSPVEARSRLESIRGVGPWTSSLVTQLAFGDPDAVIVGDYRLPRIVAWNFAGERTADDARMLELLEPYRGQRARVQALIKFGGEKPPRRGPKLDLTDLSGR